MTTFKCSLDRSDASPVVRRIPTVYTFNSIKDLMCQKRPSPRGDFFLSMTLEKVRVRVRVRVVIRAYEQVVLCACAACCWCATMRLVSWMKLSRFADEKLFGCG